MSNPAFTIYTHIKDSDYGGMIEIVPNDTSSYHIEDIIKFMFYTIVDIAKLTEDDELSVWIINNRDPTFSSTTARAKVKRLRVTLLMESLYMLTQQLCTEYPSDLNFRWYYSKKHNRKRVFDDSDHIIKRSRFI